MTRLDAPRLDDVSAQQLVEHALERLRAKGFDWQGDDPADPGRALIEAFAQITAEELKRLNALPDALQARFMATLGVRLIPGQAETAMLDFARSGSGRTALTVPAGLRIAARSAPEAVFVLLAPVHLAAGQPLASGLAARVTMVPLQPVGRGTGAGGQRIALPHDNLAGAPQAAAALRVDVEWDGPAPQGLDCFSDADNTRWLTYAAVTTDPGPERPEVQVDRAAGQLRFAASGAFLPASGALIRAAYTHLQDQPSLPDTLPADEITDPLDPLPGLSVRNPAPSVGGHPVEQPAERMARGPVSTFASSHAVRAQDYEALAREVHPAIARAHATTPAEDWAFAQPGLVDVLIAPKVTGDANGAVTLQDYEAAIAAHPSLPDMVRARLERAAPLGVSVKVNWLPARAVSVSCTLYAAPSMDHGAVRQAAERALGRFLSPMPEDAAYRDTSNDAATGWPDGWPLGRSLRVSEVIERLNAVPGVRAVDRLVLRPGFPMTGKVGGLAADCVQQGTWFLVTGGVLYRTLDGGRGWTRVPLIGATGKTTSEQSPVNAVATHPVRTGLLAVALADGTLLVSRDCGQSFTATARTDTPPEALAWADGSEAPRLLCIGPAPLTEVIGLSSTETADPPEPRPVLTLAGARVGPAWTIATHPDGRGNRAVALALRDLGGVLMSDDNGWNGSFQPVGLQGHDVRSLCFLRKGQRVWLLAGCARTVVSDQSALYCAEVTDAPLRMPEWHPADAGWPGGTVHGLAFDGTRILAASTLQGLLQGTLSDGRVVWQRPPPDAGLPARIGAAGPAPFGHVAFGPHGPPDAPQPQLLAAGPGHVLHSADGGARFAEVALRDGATRIGLPARWTLCSAPHAIEVLDVTS